MKRILIITNIPNHYRIPLFNEMNRLLKKNNFHLKILFGAYGYSRRKSKMDPGLFQFDYSFLPSQTFHFGNNEKTFFTYKHLMRHIRDFKPHCIVANGFSIAAVKVWIMSFFIKYDYFIWTGSLVKPGRNDSLLRKQLRKQLIRKAAHFIVYGSKAKEYLMQLGASEQDITISTNTVDTAHFASRTLAEKALLKNSGIKHLTYIGYLVKRKKVQQLFEAILILAGMRNDFLIDVIGDGEEKYNLQKWVKERGLSDRIIFHGFKPHHELPLWLARSSCFLFQTDFDIWGLVLNEAMAAGVPCIASENAAATFDLIKENETGYVVDFNNTMEVVEKINFCLDHPDEARKAGMRGQQFILQQATIEKSAASFASTFMKYM